MTNDRSETRRHHVSRHDGKRPHDECHRRLRRVDSASDNSAVDSVRDPPSPNSEIQKIFIGLSQAVPHQKKPFKSKNKDQQRARREFRNVAQLEDRLSLSNRTEGIFLCACINKIK